VACHATQGSSLKVSSPPPERALIAVSRLASVAALALLLGGCGDAPDHEAEHTRRARQMRDVTRMLDAMESTAPFAVAALTALPPQQVDAAPVDGAPRTAPATGTTSDRRPVFFFMAMGGLAALLALWLGRRRRGKHVPAIEVPSVAPFFAGVAEAPAPPAKAVPAPTWVYRTTSFETPGLHMIDSAVDLLVPARRGPPAGAAGGSTSLCLPDREAARLLADTEANALARSASDDEARTASALPLRMARIERMSGATRLFAIRALAVELAGARTALLLDARIGVLLAWSSWSLAATAFARLDDADATAEVLASLDAASFARAQLRRGEIRIRRAALRRPGDRLADLEEAQRCLDDAYERDPGAETALLAAQTALQRARLLPPAEAASTCSDALVHAFLAEQDAAWRSDALACRRDIQQLYESLALIPSPTNDEFS
jgi:hypothetical protein